jgi:hypothetical protein
VNEAEKVGRNSSVELLKYAKVLGVRGLWRIEGLEKML